MTALLLQVDPTNLSIVTKLNGDVMQDGNTADMIFSVAEIISFLSKVSPLLSVELSRACRCDFVCVHRASRCCLAL